MGAQSVDDPLDPVEAVARLAIRNPSGEVISDGVGEQSERRLGVVGGHRPHEMDVAALGGV